MIDEALILKKKNFDEQVNNQKYVGWRLRVGYPFFYLEPIPWHLKSNPELLAPGKEVKNFRTDSSETQFKSCYDPNDLVCCLFLIAKPF